MKEAYFTLYWRDGKTNVIKGPSIEEAFTAAGYGSGALPALDWYDNGVTNTHRYDKVKHEWALYTPLHIHASDPILSNLSGNEAEVIAFIKEALDNHNCVIIDYENQNRLTISLDLGHYSKLGWVKHLTVSFGLYSPPHALDPTEEGEWFASGTSYFAPEHIEKAVKYFIDHYKHDMSGTTNPHYSESLVHIQIEQQLAISDFKK